MEQRLRCGWGGLRHGNRQNHLEKSPVAVLRGGERGGLRKDKRTASEQLILCTILKNLYERVPYSVITFHGGTQSYSKDRRAELLLINRIFSAQLLPRPQQP